jgi:hypothetical protein
MNTSFSSVVFAVVSVVLAGNVMAQSVVVADSHTSVVQVAAINPVAPVMTHEVASMIKLTHQAQAQYRRSGNPQDLARVDVMHRELASRGFGRVTQAAPVLMAATPFAAQVDQSSVLASAAE